MTYTSEPHANPYKPLATSLIDDPTRSDNYPDPTWKTFTLADVNGDGRADVVYLNGTNDWAAAAVSLSRGDGTYGPLVTSLIDDPTRADNYPDPTWKTFTLADVNGDGRADVVYLNGTNDWAAAAVSLSRGDGTYGPLVTSLIDDPSLAARCPAALWKTFTLADVNGDGRADVVYLNG